MKIRLSHDEVNTIIADWFFTMRPNFKGTTRVCFLHWWNADTIEIDLGKDEDATSPVPAEATGAGQEDE